MAVDIRVADKADLLGILELYGQPDMDGGKVLSAEEAEAVFQKFSAYPNYHAFVAVEGSEIIGTFALAVMDNLAHQGASSGLIEDVVVKADRQGQGIGKQMMRYALDYCRQYGCYKVALSSNLKREAAHRFYRSLGFQIHGYSFSLEL